MVTIILPVYIHFYAKRKKTELKEHDKERNEKRGIENPVNVEET